MPSETVIGISTLFQFAGGLGLFLYGMQLMSDSLQKVAGERLKRILEKLTSNRFIGLAVGCIVTMVIQSSSATTVMIVGFVNAGLMNLSQALSVVLGANIGTTVTAQILSLNVSALALPAIALGAVLVIFIRKHQRLTYTGEIIMGFGLLFFGMTLMTSAFAPFKDMPEVQNLFVVLSDYRVLAAAIGMLVTLLLQSSSATIGITMALATNGLIDYPTAVALVLGENIGTTVTANLAAIGGSRSAKQAAFGHFLFNLIGVCYMLILLTPFLSLIDSITPGDPTLMVNGAYSNVARHIANAHTLFNIINALIFIPLLPLLAKLCEFFIKSDTTQGYKYTHLANAIMSLPETAVAQVRVEVARMSDVTMTMLKEARNSIQNGNAEEMSKTSQYEKTLDGFRDELLDFVNRLSARPISAVSLQKLEAMRIAVHNMEEIGDTGKSILKRAKKLVKKNPSETARQELDGLFEKVINFATEAFHTFSTGETQPGRALALEDEIDDLYRGLRQHHIKRLEDGLCEMETGMFFMDILSGLESIADYIFAIAQLNTNRKA